MDLLVKDEEEFKEADISDSEDETKTNQDDRKRNKLIDSVLALNQKQARYTQRTVAGKEISEFNFSGSGYYNKVHVGELMKCLKDNSIHNKLKKQLKNVGGKEKAISQPLPKHEQAKIDRSVAYDKTCEEISVWNSTVMNNRKKDHLEFPIESEKVEVFNNQTFCKRFLPRNPLELEVYKLLHGNQFMPKDCKVLTPAEERALKAMDLDEARKRRSDLMKYKALLNYKELKLRWKGKIKSKSYRRRLKKDRLEKEKDSINELAQSNPIEFIEKMKRVEKARVKERTSLKHRGGSKFQKRQMMYAKYDPNTQERISEMVRKNKELTKKQVVESEESDIDSEEEMAVNSSDVGVKGNNSWMRTTRISVKDSKPSTAPAKDTSEDITEDIIPKSLRETIPGREEVQPPPPEPTEVVCIDPHQVLNISTPISSSIPTLMTEADSDEEKGDVNESDRMTLSEAFADDDVVQEFAEEKRATVKENNPDDIDLTLPGWGSWSGDGIKVSARKRKRFTIKAPAGAPRKDDRLGHVIINESKDTVISKYQVKEVPFPFRNAKEFERSIQAPIGKDWNPQTAVKKLTEPNIHTKLGAIIQPINKNVLLKNRVKPNENIPKKGHTVKRKQQSKKRR